MAFTEPGFTQNAEDFASVGEGDAADAKAGRFLKQDRNQAFGRHIPDFEMDFSTQLRVTHHGRMAIPDGPEAVVGAGVDLGNKGGTRVGEVGIEFEAAHKRAVDGEVWHSGFLCR